MLAQLVMRCSLTVFGFDSIRRLIDCFATKFTMVSSSPTDEIGIGKLLQEVVVSDSQFLYMSAIETPVLRDRLRTRSLLCPLQDVNSTAA